MHTRFDNWSNTMAGLGYSLRDKVQHTNFTANSTLSDETLESLYHNDDMAARICDLLPDEMLRQGSHVRDLERSIKDKLAITKQKAQLIARDQVSKYSGDLTKHNQTYAGITHYRWQTSRDERVRSEHRELDGKEFAWDKPPVSDKSGGRFHPRQGYRCRCDAIPVVSV